MKNQNINGAMQLPQEELVHVESFDQALEIYNAAAYTTVMSDLFLARVYRMGKKDKQDDALGPAFCTLTVKNGKTYVTCLYAFEPEKKVHEEENKAVRLLLIQEGTLFNWKGTSWMLKHGKLIAPVNIMNTQIVADIFCRQGIRKPDGTPFGANEIRIGRLTFYYDSKNEHIYGLDIRNTFLSLKDTCRECGIGVAFFVETQIDGIAQIVFIRSFRGRHARSAKWFPKALTHIAEYGDRASFKSSDGEWKLYEGKLIPYEEWAKILLKKEQEERRH